MVSENIKELFAFLNKIGLMDVVLPFVIAFGLLYGIFDKTAVLGREKNGDPKKRVNMIVAGVISLMFVVSLNLVNMMTYIVWIFAGLIMAVILGMIIAGVFGARWSWKPKEEEKTSQPPSEKKKAKTPQEEQQQALMDSYASQLKGMSDSDFDRYAQKQVEDLKKLRRGER